MGDEDESVAVPKCLDGSRQCAIVDLKKAYLEDDPGLDKLTRWYLFLMGAEDMTNEEIHHAMGRSLPPV